MKVIFCAFVISMIMMRGCHSSAQSNRPRYGLNGNNVFELVIEEIDTSPSGRRHLWVCDPIDDTISYKWVVDKIYRDTAGSLFIRDMTIRPYGESGDTSIRYEFFKNFNEFLDLKTYRRIKGDYFTNNGKVYLWWGNSDGAYPIAFPGADPGTFQPFDKLCGGVDKEHVFYGGGPDDFEVIDGANPEKIEILNPSKGCDNCGNCYFKDEKHVFFGQKMIEGADPKTFKLLNQEKVDAADRNHKYFDGQVIE